MTLSDQPIGDERDVALGPLEEWIENVAASKDLSEEEVRNQMMSSYWILSELTGLMKDSGKQSPADGVSSEEGPTDVQAPSEPTSQPSGDANESVGENITDLIELADAMNGSPEQAVPGPESVPQSGSDSSDRIQSEVDRIHDDISQMRTRIDRLVDQNNSGSDPAAQAQGMLHPNAATKSDLEEVTADATSLNTELKELHSQFQDEQGRVDENFGHVEEVLEFLVERVDVFDEKIDEMADKVTRLDAEGPESDPLIRIKEAAITNGVSGASCNACDTEIDIAMLERPVCPNCSQSFGGLTTTDRWFGLVTSAELRITSHSPQSPHGARSENAQADSGRNRNQSDPSGSPNDLEEISGFNAGDSGTGSDDDPDDVEFVWSDDEP